jgi:hypothetical protein
MASYWENIKKTVKGELSDASVTTKKYWKIGKGKLDVMTITNSLNDTFRELGIKIHSQITEEKKGDIRLNPEVKTLIEKINILKQSIKDEELEIEEIKKGAAAPTKTDADANKARDVKAKKKA